MINYQTLRVSFYDIESVSNVFSLCNYRHNDNAIDAYILVDDKLDTDGDSYNRFVLDDNIKNYISDRIYEKNKNFNGTINYYDLSSYYANINLINTFGAKDDNGTFEKLALTDTGVKPFVKDTDHGYAPAKHDYLMGYNSSNYDTSMLALYISETFWLNNNQLVFSPPTAKQMREHNDNMFSPLYINKMPNYLRRSKSNSVSGYSNRENIIRLNMVRSGRHVDVALLNEKSQKLALKRILGMLGRQILESDKIQDNSKPIETLDELADLIAYNCSDIINLRYVFEHDKYYDTFELKRELLSTYPELVYEKKSDEYAPNISPTTVRKDRLYIDSSSAQLAARSLCPYGHLNDIEAVSFMYPSEKKAKEKGIPRVNVLDECRKFFYSLYPDRTDLQAEFDRIYFYYKNNIEGKNFNDSDEYALYWLEKHPDTPVLPAYSTSEIPKENLTLPYYEADGNPSRCYVAFGVGGIHGAEYNKSLYERHKTQYQDLCNLHNTVHSLYPDPRQLKDKDPITKKAWSFTYNGQNYKSTDFLASKSTAQNAQWKDISKYEPQLFKYDSAKKGVKLNDKYVFTSNDNSNHEDFTSYYPNLLIMMEAFYNEALGYDRYEEIFNNKQKYGKLMKSDISPDEKQHYSNKREGTKLVLNSASGAADVAYFTPIRMNNQIMSMRIIGQMFTWRIGQAQTFAGAKIISTNTDGLYSVFDSVENAKILAREAENIHVQIEPEFCKLVSKDSNNRIELTADNKIISASGGSLACRKGPNPTKSLAHAAILDYALCEYLRNVDNIHHDTDDFLAKPFDVNKGWSILYNARFAFSEKTYYLNMFQTIVSSSIGSQRFVFGETDTLQLYKENILSVPLNSDLLNHAIEKGDVKILPHYNRIFFVKKEFAELSKKQIYHLYNAETRVITAAQKIKRSKNNERIIQHDPYAKRLLEEYKVFDDDIPTEKEAKITKVSGINPDWYVYIENRSLFELTDEEAQMLINNLDIDVYLTLIAESYNKNWANVEGEDNTDET